MASTANASRLPVAAYKTVDGAALAVTHLVAIGYDPDRVAISPTHFEPRAVHRLLPRLRSWTASSAIAGLAAAGVYSLIRTIGFAQTVADIMPALLVGAAVGCVAGLLIALLRHRRLNVRTYAGGKRITPTRFEVIIDDETSEAAHDLAQWWDPAAEADFDDHRALASAVTS